MHKRIKPVARVLLVFFISVIIWRLMLLFLDMPDVSGNAYSRMTAGVFTSALAGFLIVTMNRIESRNIKYSIAKNFPIYLKNFVCGFICWIITVAISVYVFEMFGYLNISINAPAHILAPQLFFLFTIVFFIEAFPEEIIRSYILSNLNQSFSTWIALLIQTGLFTLFAYFIGSLYSIEQILFIPGFGFLLGYFRMLSGSALFSMGFHAAIMTVTQLLASSGTSIVVEGSFFILRFLCFILFPAIVSSILLQLKVSDRL